MYNRLIRLIGNDYPSFRWSRRLGRDRLQLEETGETNRSSLRASSRFGQHGSPLSHLNNNLLHLHMMNTTMNRQKRKTVQTYVSSMMLSLQLHNLVLGPNFKPKPGPSYMSHLHSTFKWRNRRSLVWKMMDLGD